MKQWTSIWSSRVRGEDGQLKHISDYNLNIRPNAGNDWQSRVMAGDSATLLTGTATATSATSLTSTGFTASAYIDHIVCTGTTYGVITANSTTVLTVDRWYNPASPGGAAAGTPGGTTSFTILPGSAPATYLALSTTVQSGAAGDTVLAGEIGSGDGLSRAYFTTYAHTASSSAYSLSKTFTASSTKTVNSEGLFTALTGGTLAFESAETSAPTLVSGDTLAQTVTVSY